jgi:uncharacterized protein (TIGR02757 family)
MSLSVNVPFPELKEFLEEKYFQYATKSFIERDPISIPHSFTKPQDIEIAGFLSATLAWGQRATIIKNMHKLLALMEHAPYEFLMQAHEEDFMRFQQFVHRTFNGEDCRFFLRALQHIYRTSGGLGQVFQEGWNETKSMPQTIARVREQFFAIDHPLRSRKHFADVQKGSAGKRLNMYLRWMVRPVDGGVDFGLWPGIPSSALYLPLDVHSGRVARKLGLLTRKQNDWKAVDEVTSNLRKLDPVDPVKYDYALFGLGVFEKF